MSWQFQMNLMENKGSILLNDNNSFLCIPYAWPVELIIFQFWEDTVWTHM